MKNLLIILLFIPLLFGFKSANHSYVSRVIYGESGTNYRDCWYVAQVIKNRIDYKNNTLEKVVKAKGQFSGYKVIKNREIQDSIECIIYHVINDNIPDSLRLPTDTKFFCNPKGVKSKRTMRWFNSLEKVRISYFPRKGVAHHYYR